MQSLLEGQWHHRENAASRLPNPIVSPLRSHGHRPGLLFPTRRNPYPALWQPNDRRTDLRHQRADSIFWVSDCDDDNRDSHVDRIRNDWYKPCRQQWICESARFNLNTNGRGGKDRGGGCGVVGGYRVCDRDDVRIQVRRLVVLKAGLLHNSLPILMRWDCGGLIVELRLGNHDCVLIWVTKHFYLVTCLSISTRCWTHLHHGSKQSKGPRRVLVTASEFFNFSNVR